MSTRATGEAVVRERIASAMTAYLTPSENVIGSPGQIADAVLAAITADGARWVPGDVVEAIDYLLIFCEQRGTLPTWRSTVREWLAATGGAEGG